MMFNNLHLNEGEISENAILLSTDKIHKSPQHCLCDVYHVDFATDTCYTQRILLHQIHRLKPTLCYCTRGILLRKIVFVQRILLTQHYEL